MAFSHTTRSVVATALVALATCCVGGCSMGQRFDNPDQAVSSLVDSMRTNDQPKLQQILGWDGKALLYSGDSVDDKNSVERFLHAYDESHKLVALDDDAEALHVGNDDWPMPIPVVKDPFNNKWYFDTNSGKEEILTRRIGRNELDTIQTCLAIVDAQRDYAEADPQHVGLPVYAEKFLSDPGKKNGLYWETADNEPDSPLGELAADAEAHGYVIPPPGENGPHPYHGYLFRIIKTQGPAAPGGKRDYMVDGHLLGGFAVIAYPAAYANSGVMTFIVNNDGKVYQRDLGPLTALFATMIQAYNPNSEWTPVDPDDTTVDSSTKP